MQNLATKFVLGVAVVGAVGVGYSLLNQMVKISTLQTNQLNEVSIDQALLVAQGAIDECKKNGDVITVAITDRSGGIRFLLRGDGATPADVEAARRKAYTARTFRQATSEWIKRTAPDAMEADGTTPIDLIGQRFLENTIAEAGGLPLIWHNDAIGGVGVKGAKGGGEADELCAQAGVNAIKDQLL